MPMAGLPPPGAANVATVNGVIRAPPYLKRFRFPGFLDPMAALNRSSSDHNPAVHRADPTCAGFRERPSARTLLQRSNTNLVPTLPLLHLQILPPNHLELHN